MLGRAHYFLGMVALSVLWLGTLVWVMHEVNPAPKKDMNEIDFLGADIDAQYNIASSSDCRSACEAHPQCLAFTYVISERACWLKGAGFTSKTNVNAVSGAVNWTLANERRRLANQTRQWNAGGGGGGNGDFDEFLDDDSSASEFDHGDEGDGDGEGIVPDPDGDGLWSAQQPREPSAEELAKYNDSVSVFGDVVLFLDILGASECEGLCLAERGCSSWSLDKLRSVCSLRVVGRPTVRSDPTAISGWMSAQQRESREARFAGSAGEPSVAAAEEEAAAAAAAPSNVSKATGGGLLVN